MMNTLLGQDEIQARLADLEGWDGGNKEIRKLFEFRDFKEAMRFVNAVAGLAEKADHHPDIFISWNKVTLTLTTHSAGGLTHRDFDLAKDVDFI